MTICDIETLFHYRTHIVTEPHPRLNAPAVQRAIETWITHGCLRPENGGYVTTPKARAYIGMLCDTPLPELQTSWVDPRTGDPV